MWQGLALNLRLCSKSHYVLNSFQWHWIKSNGNHSLLRITCRSGLKTQPRANNQQVQMGEKEHRHRKATLVETNQKECRYLYHVDKHSPSSGIGRRGQLINGFHSLLSLSIISEHTHAFSSLSCLGLAGVFHTISWNSDGPSRLSLPCSTASGIFPLVTNWHDTKSIFLHDPVLQGPDYPTTLCRKNLIIILNLVETQRFLLPCWANYYPPLHIHPQMPQWHWNEKVFWSRKSWSHHLN